MVAELLILKIKFTFVVWKVIEVIGKRLLGGSWRREQTGYLSVRGGMCGIECVWCGYEKRIIVMIKLLILKLEL